MRRSVVIAGALLAACGGGSEAALSAEEGAELSGGDTTVFDTSRMAFAKPTPNLSAEHRDAHFAGNALFNRNWVTAPSSTKGLDGLGPTFNAGSCSACHFKDGRGAPPERDDEAFVGLLIRLSVPGKGEHGDALPEPRYGGQFNHRAVAGVPAEGESFVRYDEVEGTFADGTRYTLAAPTYGFRKLAFGPMADDVMLSPRVAPAVFGLGLLEAVSEADILALADADDEDDDGISGRPNMVWDPKSATTKLGRFGWKSNQPGLEQQNTGAFLGDIGITTPLHTGENCPAPQLACAEATTGGTPELDQRKVDFVTLYTRTLGVPARRDVDDVDVLRGEELFADLGCASCHTPTLKTGRVKDLPELSEQTFHPYTDLLLHDMGEALADGRPDFDATGSEWRTAPLWGIGLVETVNQHTRFLHDGRARNVSEAILWHGGEAEAARDGYRALDADERAQLLAFLSSL